MKGVGFKTLNDAYFPDWMEAIERVEALDFDILVPGHGHLGAKADARDHRAYLDDLHAAVLKAARAGQSVDEMKQAIKLEQCKDWGQYKAWPPLNIEGMANDISLHRRGN